MRQSVLMIDDEADFCELVKMSLAREHIKVDCAASLAEGLEQLKELQPEVLMLDNNLPDGLGWTQAATLQKQYPDMKIILLSAYEIPPYETTGIGMQFERMAKPVRMKELIKQLS